MIIARAKLLGRVLFVTAYVTLGWTLGLLILVWWVVDASGAYLRAREARAAFTRCPRNHIVPQFGVYRCPCRTVYEGNVWSCPTCGDGGLTDCPSCGLTLFNPRLR